MAEKSFNYFGTMLQLQRDYALTRLNEIREEAKMLEAFLGNGADAPRAARAPQQSATVDPTAGSLQARVLDEVKAAPTPLRPVEVTDRLVADGWRFRDRRTGVRAVSNSLSRLVELGKLSVRKDGDTRRSPVFYSPIWDAEPEGT